MSRLKPKFCNIILSILLSIILFCPPGQSTFNQTQVLLQANPYLAAELLNEYNNFTEGVQSSLGVSAMKKSNVEDHEREGIKYPVQSSLRRVDQEEVSSSNGGVKTGTGTEASANLNLNSLIGVTSVLAIVHENIWYALRLPAEGVSNIIRSAPASLSSMMGTLLKSSEENYNTKIRNLIFTPTWIKTTLNLINLKAEVKQAYFEYPEKAMDTVNHIISTRYGGSFTLPDYLIEPLPNTTESLIISGKEQRGIWPETANYVGSSLFYQYKNPENINNRRNSRSGNWTDPDTESVDMFEIFGSFGYGQNERFEYITIPFQMTKLQLTLILPRENQPDLSFTPEQLQSLNLPKSISCHTRVRLPIKTFVTRNPVKFSNSTDDCTESSSNVYKGHCLKFLDTLTYTSFSPAQFKSITLTGGVIANSYNSFLKSAAAFAGGGYGTKHKFHRNRFGVGGLELYGGNLDPWRLSPPKKSSYSRNSHPISFPKYWQWRSSFFPSHNRFAISSNQQNNYNRYYSTDNVQIEKILVFDRPFFWFVQGAL